MTQQPTFDDNELEKLVFGGRQTLIEEFMAVLPELNARQIEQICGDRSMPRSVIGHRVSVQNEMGRAYLENYLRMTVPARSGRGIVTRTVGAVGQVLMWLR